MNSAIEECEIIVNWHDDLNVHVENVPRSKLERVTQQMAVPEMEGLAAMSICFEENKS